MITAHHPHSLTCVHPSPFSLPSSRDGSLFPSSLGLSGKVHLPACGGRPFGVQPHHSTACRAYEGGSGGNDGGGSLGGGGGGGHGGGASGDGAYGKAKRFGVFGSAWARYLELLDDHPLIIKSLTAGALNLLADLICQLYLDKVQHIDIQRLLSFTSIGLFMSGPGLHIWYGLLPKVIRVPGFPGVLLRLMADQLVFTPLGVGCLFIALCTLEGRQHELEGKLRKDWLPLVVANWKVWFPFQLINFGLIPPQLQVAATSLMGVGWSIFISFIGHQ